MDREYERARNRRMWVVWGWNRRCTTIFCSRSETLIHEFSLAFIKPLGMSGTIILSFSTSRLPCFKGARTRWPPTLQTSFPQAAQTKRRSTSRVPTPSMRGDEQPLPRSTAPSSRTYSNSNDFIFLAYLSPSWFHFKVCLVAGVGFFTDAYVVFYYLLSIPN